MGAIASKESTREQLINRYIQIRSESEQICSFLENDDYQVQSIVQTSPPKWHLAHVSWLFENFVLSRFSKDYQTFDPAFDYIFNSYYYTHGEMHPRRQRGLLSRPTLDEVFRYRAYVDDHAKRLINTIETERWEDLSFYITLGLHHEQQHQELMLMDVKHNFSMNPIQPAYRDDLSIPQGEATSLDWVSLSGGIKSIGHQGENFAYDNETPRHEVLLGDFKIANRLVTNGEYLEFIKDDGYNRPELWLSDGWALLQEGGCQHPLYWSRNGSDWSQYTLGGVRELSLLEPVCHVNYYEADAFARWAGKRLPLEAEMELALAQRPIQGNFRESDLLHPAPATADGQWHGDLWTWTASPYSAYPGFKPLAGSIGEYNGKFMSNQMVLRGGSCVTPADHVRTTYRNFFYPNERWAFTGIRLADTC